MECTYSYDQNTMIIKSIEIDVIFLGSKSPPHHFLKVNFLCYKSNNSGRIIITTFRCLYFGAPCQF